MNAEFHVIDLTIPPEMAGRRLDSAQARLMPQHSRTRIKGWIEAGAVTVLYHSVFWQYMPRESQAALAKLIGEIGGRATADAPFAWLRMEPPGAAPGMEVRLTLWPGGEERLLADVHPHGAFVRWHGG